MKLVRLADGKIGLFVLLPKGAHAIDIASSLGVFSHDPLSNGLLNGVLKDGHHWSLLVNHWAHLRSPLKKLQNVALKSPDHPCLVLQSLVDGPGMATAADPIIAIEITDIETFEEQDPTGRRAMERQFIPPPESNSPRGSTATETAQVIDFSSIRAESSRR
jgi:hypothetical protein